MSDKKSFRWSHFSLFRIFFFVRITVDQNLSMTWLYICASHFIQPFFQFLAFIQGSFETMRGDALLFSLEENYPHSESDKKTDDQESILNIKHMLYKHTEVKLRIQKNIVQVNYLRSIHRFNSRTQMNVVKMFNFNHLNNRCGFKAINRTNSVASIFLNALWN